MEQFLKISGLVIGVIAGLLGLLKAILEIRKQYREDKSLSTLLASRQVRIGAGLAIIGLAALIGSAWWLSRPATLLIVQIWDVEQDEKHAIIASQQFTDISGSILPDDKLQQLGAWLVEQVEHKYQLHAEELQISVHAPADLRSQRLAIDVTPSGPVQVYYWIVGDVKSRVPLSEQALAELGEDFYLEISRPGYETKVIRVPWGQESDTNFTMQPIPVRIGIEDFEGQKNSIATQLADYLTANSRFSVTDPSNLEKIKEKIAEDKDLLAKNPAAQIEVRSLGVDLIVSGRNEAP
jgi:hypothetical protein